MYSRFSKNPIVLAGVFALSFALGKAGLLFGGFSVPPAAVWPPSGFALAVVILFGRSVWPAVFAGALFVYATATGHIAASVALAFGDTFAAVVGAAFVDRFARGAQAFTNANAVFRFVAIAAFVSAPLSAVFGVAAVTINGPIVLGDVAYVWMTWWLANLSGILVVAPFVTLWATTPPNRGRWLEMLEALLLLVLLVGVGLVVFAGKFPSDVKDYPLEFLCVPFLLWAAFRFGRREMASAIVILSGVAVWGTLRGFGPFVRDSRSEAVVLLQAYTSVMAITGVALAAVVAEHKRAEAQLRELATTDPLTGLANYRRLMDVLRSEIQRSGRTRRPFALLFVDMNGLKRINDRHGHVVGSRAICRLADVLRRSCRSIDTAARFGGDEFAVVLPETDEDGGRVVLARICEKLAADYDKPAVSVSGGVALFPRDGDSLTLLLRFADKVLYEAKTRATTARKATVHAKADDERKTGTLF